MKMTVYIQPFRISSQITCYGLIDTENATFLTIKVWNMNYWCSSFILISGDILEYLKLESIESVQWFQWGLPQWSGVSSTFIHNLNFISCKINQSHEKFIVMLQCKRNTNSPWRKQWRSEPKGCPTIYQSVNKVSLAELDVTDKPFKYRVKPSLHGRSIAQPPAIFSLTSSITYLIGLS